MRCRRASQGCEAWRDTGLFSGGEDSLAEKVLVPGRSGTEGMENRVWMGRGQAGGQQSGHLLPGGPGEGRSELERRHVFWARPSHLFLGISSLLTGFLPVYSCSKSGEDLFASQESIYSAFSFSNPVTLRFFFLFVWLHLPITRGTIPSPSRANSLSPHPRPTQTRLAKNRGPCCDCGSWGLIC